MARKGAKVKSTKAPTAQRSEALAVANQRRAAIRELKAEARSGRLDVAALLADPRARQAKVLSLLPMVPRCTLHVALEALLACQINGARTCGELSVPERTELARAVQEVGHGVGRTKHPPAPANPAGRDVELDRAITRTRTVAVELSPAEFAAARTGLEVDPLLLRMVDRLVAALRLYAVRDDGGQQAHVVLEQWLRYRNYLAKLAAGEYTPPSVRGPAEVE